MKLLSFLAAALGSAGRFLLFNMNGFYCGSISSRRGKGRIDKSALSYGYPGAKMARKVIQKAIAVKHPCGLRTNDIGFAQQ